MQHGYDAVGNVDHIWDARNSEDVYFNYDALDRLTGTQSGGAYSASYSYNQIGNLLSKTEGGTTYTISYPPAGQPRPHAPSAVNGSAYTYDANGNPTQDKWRSNLAWDDANRLTSVTYSGNTTSYDYDGDGQRVKRTMLGVTTVYVGAYYEKDLSTGVVTKYYYLGGRRVALRQGGTVRFLLGDHLGSTRVTADSNGNRVAELWY